MKPYLLLAPIPGAVVRKPVSSINPKMRNDSNGISICINVDVSLESRTVVSNVPPEDIFPKLLGDIHEQMGPTAVETVRISYGKMLCIDESLRYELYM